MTGEIITRFFSKNEITNPEQLLVINKHDDIMAICEDEDGAIEFIMEYPTKEQLFISTLREMKNVG